MFICCGSALKTLRLFFVAVIKNVAINNRNGIFEEESKNKKKIARKYALAVFSSLFFKLIWACGGVTCSHKL